MCSKKQIQSENRSRRVKLFSLHNCFGLIFKVHGRSVLCRHYIFESGKYPFQCRICLLPTATKLGQGYVFTRACDSVHGGGGVLVPGVSGLGRSGPGGGGCLVGGCLVETPPYG